ncbi:hypothetical protein [Streptomyces goshikiensis]|uniref:hypothetical protein n=1 Tax=Streptomyces goshikiensis TaxID=1942 RepID=UPI0036B5D3AD
MIRNVMRDRGRGRFTAAAALGLAAAMLLHARIPNRPGRPVRAERYPYPYAHGAAGLRGRSPAGARERTRVTAG